jgi:hypothetical protein
MGNYPKYIYVQITQKKFIVCRRAFSLDGYKYHKFAETVTEISAQTIAREMTAYQEQVKSI